MKTENVILLSGGVLLLLIMLNSKTPTGGGGSGTASRINYEQIQIGEKISPESDFVLRGYAGGYPVISKKPLSEYGESEWMR